jgi:D-serine deaminase-like pyridoxal phosphate-dependent protein
MYVTDLDTPTPVIDLDLVDKNIHRAQAYADTHGLALRPHIKTHKLPELAHLQLRAGAQGVTCQKIGEAEVMADAGVTDILISFNIVGRTKLERLRSLARRADCQVVADSEAVLLGLSETFANEARRLPVMIECDTGGQRCGVATPQAAAELAVLTTKLPGLVFRGLMTYPPKHRVKEVGDWLEAARAACRDAGVEVEVISSGGTPDFFQAHAQRLVTEYRPGTYIYSDRAQVASGHGTLEDCALRIVATVVSRPAEDRCILDAGSKTLSSDTLGLTGFGHILEYPDIGIVALSEEHGHCHIPPGTKGPVVGERVTIVPNHACAVTNLFDRIPAMRGGRLEAMLTIAARGKVQ